MGRIKITNKYIGDVIWAKPPDLPQPAGNHIDTFKICSSSNLRFMDDFLSLLSPAEVERANRYLRVEDRNRSVISRGALRIILGKYLHQSPSAIQFGFDKNKKPFLINGDMPGLHFNVSHSGDWLLITVSGHEIGVDVELINPGFPYRDILTDYFTDDEARYILEKNADERFFMLWTRKEALTKATGTGLHDKLKYIPSLDGEHYTNKEILPTKRDMYTTSFKLNDGYIASVGGYADMETNFWEVSF
jgi:4'-phosphopantetheinyl transferase